MRTRPAAVSGAVAVLVSVAAMTCTVACSSQTAGLGTGAGPRGVASDSTSASSSSNSPSASRSRSSSASSSASASTHPVPAAPLRTVTAHGSGGTTYVIKVWAETHVTDCAAHAYGAAVTAYLRAHPCYAMSQLLATTTVNGKDVGFAQRSIGFRGAGDRSYRVAGRFRDLVTRSGTGNLNDLMREGYRLPSGPTQVPFPNAFSALAQDNGVTVVEAWYLNGPTPDNDPQLVRMAQDIFLQV